MSLVAGFVSLVQGSVSLVAVIPNVMTGCFSVVHGIDRTVSRSVSCVSGLEAVLDTRPHPGGIVVDFCMFFRHLSQLEMVVI